VGNITSTRTYTLTVTGPGGTADCSATITVSIQQGLICTLTANKTNIQPGDSVLLSWTSTNATSATLSSVGSVAVNGSTTVFPQNTTTYTLVVSGPSGSETCTRTITINEPNAPTCTLSASPTQISHPGQGVTLSYSSSNAQSAFISNHGNVSVNTSGSIQVFPFNTTTYTMTVTGQGGTQTCSATVTVQPNVPHQPSCTLTFHQSSPYGAGVLSWSSTNAVYGIINNGIGTVAPSGSRQVQQSGYQATYMLTVYSSTNQTAVCYATNNYQPPVYYPPIPQPPNPPISIPHPIPQPYVHVALTDIPYTGLDAPVAYLLYFLSLIGVAVLGAYVLYTYRNEALAFVSFGNPVRQSKGKSISTFKTYGQNENAGVNEQRFVIDASEDGSRMPRIVLRSR